jgi:hypothetical protein
MYSNAKAFETTRVKIESFAKLKKKKKKASQKTLPLNPPPRFKRDLRGVEEQGMRCPSSSFLKRCRAL